MNIRRWSNETALGQCFRALYEVSAGRFGLRVAVGMATLNTCHAVQTDPKTESVMEYQRISIPDLGEKITVNPDHSLSVPDKPIIP